MPTVIPVKFTYAARDLWFSPAGTGAQEGDHVICQTERGREIGLATADAREVSATPPCATWCASPPRTTSRAPSAWPGAARTPCPPSAATSRSPGWT